MVPVALVVMATPPNSETVTSTTALAPSMVKLGESPGPA